MLKPTSSIGAACLLVAVLYASCTLAPVARVTGRKNTTLDKRNVHYTVSGQGTTVLTLVHGWASDQRAWWKNVSELSQDYCVITIDLPGHGQSAEPRVPYSMSLFADAIAAVLDAESVNRTILVGHSNGVPTVREFYRNYGERVAKLVFIDGALKNMVPPEQKQPFLEMFSKPSYKSTVRRFVTSMPAPNLEASDREYLAAMAESQAQHAVLGGLEAAFDSAIWKDDTISVPVLMINARQPAWNVAYEEYVRDLVPDIDYRVLPDVGHFVMVERSQEFNQLVREFVEGSGE